MPKTDVNSVWNTPGRKRVTVGATMSARTSSAGCLVTPGTD